MPRATFIFRLLASLLFNSCILMLVPGCTGISQPAPAERTQPKSSNAQLAGHADAEKVLRESISRSVQNAWAKSDFAALDSAAEDYVQTRARTFSGKWRLAIFYGSLSDQMQIEWPDDWWLTEARRGCRCKIPDPDRYQEADLRWDALQAKFDLWRERFPRSPHAQVARAQFLVNRAWFYRGTGFANTVPDVAWPRVEKYVEAARQILIETRPTSIADPDWFDIMFFIASAQSWSHSRVEATVHDFYEFGKTYAPAYQSASALMLPKWGGSYEMFEGFAREAVLRSAPEEGVAIYARIYWRPEFGTTIFRNTLADWPTMKRGFDEIIRKYPDPRNLNGKAMFACIAGDAAIFNSTMQQLGDRVTPDTWMVPVESCKSLYSPAAI
jgi:Domain of unknown function (DUF4034)